MQGFADEMKLHVLGNKNQGYYVNIYYGSQLIMEQGYYVNIYYGSQLIMEQGKAGELDLYFDNEDYSVRETQLIMEQGKAGELDLYFDNEDYSVRETLKGWKATSVEQSERKVVLSGNVYLKKLEADLSVNVIYEVVSSQLVSKRIELQQNNLSLLYYSVGTSITACRQAFCFLEL